MEAARSSFGAAARLRETIGAPVRLVDRADHDRTVDVSLALLGPEAYQAAWAAGQVMSVDEVIAFAGGSASEASPTARVVVRPPLIAREREARC